VTATTPRRRPSRSAFASTSRSAPENCVTSAGSTPAVAGQKNVPRSNLEINATKNENENAH
jgi:hypothetical protein